MTAHRPGHPPSRARGFTLLELTLVMGLLGVFSVFLVQLLAGGVELFEEGESGQELADRAAAASDAAVASFDDMVGPRREVFDESRPSARLLVQWAPLGMRPGGEPGDAVQVVRATVRVSAEQERRLLARVLRQEAEDTAATLIPEDVAARLRELVEAAPRRGRAQMLLLPWPAGDPDGAFLELRKGLFLIGERIRISRREEVDLMAVEDLVRGGLTPEVVRRITEPVAVGLLHVGFAFQSQLTRDWQGAPGQGGPELVWDSARAGLLVEGDDPRRRFSLDLQPESLEDPTDDVFPRWVRITLVVDRPGSEARLARAVGRGDKELRLAGFHRLPDPEYLQHLKIGGEWVRFSSMADGVVRGARRGRRGTRPRPHEAGATVRAGKTVVLYVRLPHGRDCWNG